MAEGCENPKYFTSGILYYSFPLIDILSYLEQSEEINLYLKLEAKFTSHVNVRRQRSLVQQIISPIMNGSYNQGHHEALFHG